MKNLLCFLFVAAVSVQSAVAIKPGDMILCKFGDENDSSDSSDSDSDSDFYGECRYPRTCDDTDCKFSHKTRFFSGTVIRTFGKSKLVEVEWLKVNGKDVKKRGRPNQIIDAKICWNRLTKLKGWKIGSYVCNGHKAGKINGVFENEILEVVLDTELNGGVIVSQIEYWEKKNVSVCDQEPEDLSICGESIGDQGRRRHSRRSRKPQGPPSYSSMGLPDPGALK